MVLIALTSLTASESSRQCTTGQWPVAAENHIGIPDTLFSHNAWVT